MIVSFLDDPLDLPLCLLRPTLRPLSVRGVVAGPAEHDDVVEAMIASLGAKTNVVYLEGIRKPIPSPLDPLAVPLADLATDIPFRALNVLF